MTAEVPQVSHCGPAPAGDDTPAGPPQLAAVLSNVAQKLAAATGMGATLAAIIDGAVATVPGADAAGITEVRGRRDLQVQYATSDLVRAVDNVQQQTGQGPSLDAAYDRPTVLIGDLRREARWPAYSSALRDLGVGSILCFRLYVQGDTLGALNLYGHRPDAFDRNAQEVGLLFAVHAALAIAAERHLEQLTIALDSRDIIGQAKGILMERYRVPAPTAFAMLVRASQRSGQKLHDVAETLAGTRGDLPVQRPDHTGSAEQNTGDATAAIPGRPGPPPWRSLVAGDQPP